MKECDNSTRKIHISSNFILSISLLIMFDTLLLRPSLHCNTPLHFTTLHPSTLHFATLHHTSPNYTSLHFATLHHTSPNYTSIHFTTLHPTTLLYTSLHFTTLHPTSLRYTSPHFTQLHFTTLRYTSPHFTQLRFTTLRYTSPHFTVRCREIYVLLSDYFVGFLLDMDKIRFRESACKPFMSFVKTGAVKIPNLLANRISAITFCICFSFSVKLGTRYLHLGCQMEFRETRGRECHTFSLWAPWHYIYARTVKSHDISKVKKALVTSVYRVTRSTPYAIVCFQICYATKLPFANFVCRSKWLLPHAVQLNSSFDTIVMVTARVGDRKCRHLLKLTGSVCVCVCFCARAHSRVCAYKYRKQARIYLFCIESLNT